MRVRWLFPIQNKDDWQDLLDDAFPGKQEWSADDFCAFALAGLAVELMAVDFSRDEEEVLQARRSFRVLFAEDSAFEVFVKALDSEKFDATGSQRYLCMKALKAQLPQERWPDVLGFLFEIAAADDVIDGHENEMILQVSKSFSISHRKFTEIRLRFKEKREVFQL